MSRFSFNRTHSTHQPLTSTTNPTSWSTTTSISADSKRTAPETVDGTSATTAATTTNQTAQTQVHPSQDSPQNSLSADRFVLAEIARCGFPCRPSCIACDSDLKLIAVGTQLGQIKIYGKEFVQLSLFGTFDHSTKMTSTPSISDEPHHQTRQQQTIGSSSSSPPPSTTTTNTSAVWFVAFRTNHAALISINDKNIICLWDLKRSTDKLVMFRAFSKDTLTAANLSPSNMILYVGGQSGTVYIVNASNLSISSTILYWNRCVGPTVHSHPGPVAIITSIPCDHTRILVAFSKQQKNPDTNQQEGFVCRINLKSNISEAVLKFRTGLTAISLNYDGKSFMCAHTDGSYSIWSIKDFEKPIRKHRVHATITNNQTGENDKPIIKALWITGKEFEPKIVFSGGLHIEKEPSLSRSYYLTVEKRKSINVLQMESAIIDMCLLYQTAGRNADPSALILLLESDLMIIDIKADEFKYFDCPHSTDFGINPITSFNYFSDPERQLHQSLLKLSATERPKVHREPQLQKSISSASFPINGGQVGQTVFGYSELIVAGHVDGSVTFWDCTALNLSPLCSFNVSKFLSKIRKTQQSENSATSSPGLSPNDVDSANEPTSTIVDERLNQGQEKALAVCFLKFSDDYRELIVAGRSHYIALFTMDTSGTNIVSDELNDIEKLVINIRPKSTNSPLTKNHNRDSFDEQTFKSPLKVKLAYRKQPGWQPQLLCLIKWLVSSEPEPLINQIEIDATQKLIFASINDYLIVIDYLLKNIVMNMSVCDIYKFSDRRRTPSRSQPHTIFSFESTSDPLSSRSTSVTEDPNQVCKSAQEIRRAEKSMDIKKDETKLADSSPLKALALETMMLTAPSTRNHRLRRKSDNDLTQIVPVIDKKMIPSAIPRPPDSPPRNTISRMRDQFPLNKRHHSEHNILKTLGRTIKKSFNGPHTFKGSISDDAGLFSQIANDTIFQLLLLSPSDYYGEVMNASEQKERQDSSSAHLNDQKSRLSRLSSSSNSHSQLNLLVGCGSGLIIVMNISISVDQSRFVNLAPTGETMKLTETIILLDIIKSNESSSPPMNALLLAVSLKQMKTFHLSDYSAVSERSFNLNALKAWQQIVSSDSVVSCVCVLFSNQSLVVYTIAELQPLKVLVGTFEHVPREYALSAESSMCLSSHGRVAFLASPTEIQKSTIIHDDSIQIMDTICTFSTSPNDGPTSIPPVTRPGRSHPPASGGGLSHTLYRILIGDSGSPNDSFDDQLVRSGFEKEPHGIARPVQRLHGSGQHKASDAAMTSLDDRNPSSSTTARSAVSHTNDAMNQLIRSGLEREEKLSQLESTVAAMADDAGQFRSVARQLADREKQRSEKWWQLWKR